MCDAVRWQRVRGGFVCGVIWRYCERDGLMSALLHGPRFDFALCLGRRGRFRRVCGETGASNTCERRSGRVLQVIYSIFDRQPVGGGKGISLSPFHSHHVVWRQRSLSDRRPLGYRYPNGKQRSPGSRAVTHVGTFWNAPHARYFFHLHSAWVSRTPSRAPFPPSPREDCIVVLENFPNLRGPTPPPPH